jgi:RNA polymerase sigma-32 factor
MTRTLIPLTASLHGEGGLAGYLRAVNAAPLLTAEEERDLARRYRQTEDLDAARQLVFSNLRHVARVARGFSGYGLPQADLIQEGNIGLMKAVKHYDPEHGVRLLSFAVHWIRAEIYDFVLRNWRIVKVATTKAQRKLFFNLRKSRTHNGWMSEQEVERLAAKLNVPVSTVREMEGRLTQGDVAFDPLDDADDEHFQATPAGYLRDMRYNPEAIVSREDSETQRDGAIHAALAKLDDRARTILRRRWLDDDKATLHELAAEFGVSAERIRQIEANAIKKLRKLVVAETG